MLRECRWWVGLLALISAVSPAVANDRLQFNRDIRPILSDRCFACHGNDKSRRAVEMRLDVRESAVATGGIVPGKPDDSEIIRRMESDDADTQMPPPHAKLGKLSRGEIDLLRQWIAEGAEYEPHWAFMSLKPLALPKNAAPTPIDAIVWDGLAKRGLVPRPIADKTTLLRRVTFDLTGLPPTPAEIDAFLRDTSPNAYEKVVDRLLQSPAYGERMAVDWLDISRYADSYGFQVDRERDVWVWRDWVIKAFNQNLPFDQFVTWQLAGDLLPQPTDEKILATAFNRLHQQETEGGSVEEEYRVEYVCDRVQTFATAFLGLTFECARCHDHKFDPVTQNEYYGLFSMFQNIDEAGLYAYFTASVPTPTLDLRDPATKEQLAGLQAAVRTEIQALQELRTSRAADLDAWLRQRPAQLALPGEVARFSFDASDQGKLANSANPEKPATIGGENRLVPGRVGQAIEFTGDDPVSLGQGNFGRHEPFSVALWLKTPDVKDRAVVFHRSQAWTDAGSRGYELLIVDGHLQWSLIHFWPGNAISIAAMEPLPVNEWTHVVVTSDGSSQAAGLALFVNGQRAPITVVKDHLTREITGGGGDHITLGERMRDRGFKHGLIDEFRVFDRQLTPLEARVTFDPEASLPELQTPAADLSPSLRQTLADYYFAAVNDPVRQQLTRVAQARAAYYAAAERVREIMVMQELPTPKTAYKLFRGEYNHRREPVPPGVPAALSPFPKDAPLNRLGLARWVTDRQHPLMARVTVNRIWQSMFGVGLVKTAEDFGSQSALPVYQPVLDWLALRFIESGWDTKALMKTIVMTHTYQQHSLGEPAVMADDPENLWLARGPRLRLSAEMLRDNALASAGLLKLQVGGPPVFPYEMSESFKPASPSAGEGVYRRSIYTQWRRTGPPPAMLAFDAPRRAVCTAKRERTDSPLQPLILLNGVQYVEAARVLGEHLLEECSGNLPDMIRTGCIRCLGREPSRREQEILTQLYEEQLRYFTTHPDEAKDILMIGSMRRSRTLEEPRSAAALVLAQALLNHDEAVVKR